jgi:hypothetical protein
LIYLAKRHPGTTPEEFRENWRGHSALAATFPALRSRFDVILQCAVVSGGSSGNEPSEYDGTNLLTMRSLVDAIELWDEPSQPTMLADELRVFSGPVHDTSVTANETVLRDGATTSAVALQFVRAGEELSQERFISEWSGRYARSLMALPAFDLVRRFVHNHRVLPARPGFPWDGVSEMWFDDLTAARQLLCDLAYREVAEQSWPWSAPSQTGLVCEVNKSWFRSDQTAPAASDVRK